MSKLVFLITFLLSLQHSTAQDDGASVEGKKCPPGFKLASKNTCIKITKIKATLNCPAGFDAFRGRCKKVVRSDPTPTCQNGFTYDAAAKRCVKTQSTAPICPKNFKKEGDRCLKLLQVKASCKKGSTFSGGKCVQELRDAPKVEQSCRDGFQLGNDGKCRKQENAIAFCKDGQLVDGARCKTTEFTGLTCADGYRLVNNRCEKRTGFVCKEGKLAGDKCIITTQTPAICPKPFLLVNGRCQKPITQAPQVSCPNGGKFDSNTKKCVDTRPLQKACREGFSGPDSNGKCTKKTVDVRNAECREGKDDGSRCRIESHPQTSFYCRSGFTLKGDKCYGHLIIPAKKRCSGWGNYVHTNGKCHHHDVDPKICPKNYSESNGRCRCRSKDPRWCPHGKETHKRCESGFRELPEYEQKRIGRGLACIKAEQEVKTYYSCISSSFQLRGDKCYRSIVIPAAKRLACRKEQGQLVNGKTCVRFVNKTCASGYHLRDGKCFRTIITTEDAKAVCPSGFHQRGNLCVRVTDPKIECAAGLKLDAAAFLCRGLEFTGLICEGGLQLQGNVCIGTTTVDAQCPSGFQSSGRDCVAFRDAMCPAGFTRQADKCAKDSFAPADFRCASNSATLQGKLCITTEPATVTKTCETGYIRDGEFCLKVIVTPAECPDEFSLSGLFCERTISADLVCRKGGFTLVNGSCDKEVQRTPRFKCDEGAKYRKNQNECITTIFEDGTFSCESLGAGFELKKGGTCQKREVVDANTGHGKH